MNLSAPRVLLAGVAIIGVTWLAAMFGLSIEQFLAGVIGGGVLTLSYPPVKSRLL